MEDITYDKSRVINFSDAVFSIAMTLLVLEVAVPSFSEIKSQSLGQVLANRIPDFIGLFVSFLVSGLYWVAHLRIIRFVSTVNGKLLWINIFLLLSIVLLPFSTALFVKGFDYSGPFMFYCFNLAVIGILNNWMLWYVYRKEKGGTGFTRLYYLWYRNRGLNVIIVWLLGVLLVTAAPSIARIIFIFIFVNQFFIDRYFKRKIQKASEE
ncbi:TMEM175 family protein [Dokdonia sp.]|uniref:TMEM175 family protein n=1 Tax=Dokdonia sp. TaxID=2024995 RepID=UPI0032651493